MTRFFKYDFEPMHLDPVPASGLILDPTDIEDAGIREVLQTPAVAYGTWSVLDALLAPTGTGTPFLFREPLGQAREVKVALSGLFGRFVARAYLEKYFGLAVFAHLGSRSILLNGQRRITVRRLSGGDLPDWIACTGQLTHLTVAEAKGCHNPRGPAQALKRAWAQVQRVDVLAGPRKATVKRIAVATRWGTQLSGPKDTWLSVKDPDDEGETLEPPDEAAIFIGLLRLHLASMVGPLGYPELAEQLRQLTREAAPRRLDRAAEAARRALDAIPFAEVAREEGVGDLVGGVVTRAGPITGVVASRPEQDALTRLNLRPVYVGVERALVRAAIDGDVGEVRDRLQRPRARLALARPDNAGGWIVPLGAEQRNALVGT